MKKTIFVCAACISIVMVHAQDNKSSVAQPVPPAPPIAMVAPLPPPPPPPPLVKEDEIPAPPLPPVPPEAPSEPVDVSYSAIIVNDHGYIAYIRNVKGTNFVYIDKNKDGKTQKIKLSTWNANRKYYEKKYGKLPPPPPAPPVPTLEEQATFSVPVIKKDSQ
ncbi:hypothetical protein BH11BAC4_BH11BAC4_07520 [soil metagenome]